MSITAGDLAAIRAHVHLFCRQCGKILVLNPAFLASRHGPNSSVPELVRRMRCEEDGMMPDAAIVLDNAEVGREAARRKLRIHPPGLGFSE
jgi:hypothetical protein